ncbi:hypothetical protein [Mesorhizobium sp. STM 4661]|uniref:hypothetical protein n=1 Tax=Mesorhizobium sp. STM 4661 TaxID=1297570 RepID=UPI0009D96F39|nr:hypothetical protein [Mesorhizobium sp. STM 4661]
MDVKTIKWCLAILAVVAGLALDGSALGISGLVVSKAQARVGRPLTPRSVAGVGRRTTRRVIRRSTIYVARLPASCGKVVINGVHVWHCGHTYYQATGGRYVVVYP